MWLTPAVIIIGYGSYHDVNDDHASTDQNGPLRLPGHAVHGEDRSITTVTFNRSCTITSTPLLTLLALSRHGEKKDPGNALKDYQYQPGL